MLDGVGTTRNTSDTASQLLSLPHERTGRHSHLASKLGRASAMSGWRRILPRGEGGLWNDDTVSYTYANPQTIGLSLA